MAFRFKSRSTGDVVMLEHNAKQLLQILGKEQTGPGILLAEQMPAAIEALQAAVAHEEAEFERKKKEAIEKGEYVPDPERVSLRTRVAPFIDMLKHCMSERTEVVWGV
ncbi:MAG: DUF1840 domain-containing protein [Serpentinimonas sp.]|jgi:Fe-S cluster assembly ATPase SufC|nr:DUF1840 domain-containing protein [Serpentinimonas sp.]